MKAAVYYQNGGPEVFRYEDVHRPACAQDGVVIEVEAISIEGGDHLSRERSPLVNTPHIVGYQCAGKIVEVGVDVSTRSIGQRVVCIVMWGSHAEYVAAPAAMTWLLPDNLSTQKGAVVPVAFSTSHECLFSAGKLESGQSVLIHTGSGGVGLASIQMAKRAGATVFTTTSDESKRVRLTEIGADVVINSRSENVSEVVKSSTDGEGVDLVIDSVGGMNLVLSVDSLKYAGRAIFVGASGRDRGNFDPLLLWPNCTSLHGVYLPRTFEADYKRIHDAVSAYLKQIGDGELKVEIDKVFPLSAVKEAYEYISSHTAFGRVLLRP
jgi:NADPH2:quinone reductase